MLKCAARLYPENKNLELTFYSIIIKQHQRKVLLKSFHLNGHSLALHPDPNVYTTLNNIINRKPNLSCMGHTTQLRGMASTLRIRHTHITRAVTVMDSCFGLIRPHQHNRKKLLRSFQLNGLAHSKVRATLYIIINSVTSNSYDGRITRKFNYTALFMRYYLYSNKSTSLQEFTAKLQNKYNLENIS